MRKPFEQWAEQEITRLRTEADALERALRKYVESESRNEIASLPTVTVSHHGIDKRTRKGRRKGSKSELIFNYIEDSGRSGVTLRDLYQFAEAQELKMESNSIRSVIWYAKKKGRVIARNGRIYDRRALVGSTEKEENLAEVVPARFSTSS